MSYGFISHGSLATGALDYTNALVLLKIGLFGLLALSGGMIAWTAIRHLWSQTEKSTIAAASPPESTDWAA